VSSEEMKISEDTSQAMIVWQDKLHFYRVEYSVNGNLDSLSLEAQFK
jgi:hypothetical protein